VDYYICNSSIALRLCGGHNAAPSIARSALYKKHVKAIDKLMGRA